ncbi:hypothetical protein [uncultured Neptuniibacter sp.]|uniref:hypothetical protein n=1 Tax=uncultured Neptuniibacter sp. TaxID=502143 RepID=UPI00261E4F2B|nr:hypothetical protein [uncultured Neptuniibacter sp.]
MSKTKCFMFIFIGVPWLLVSPEVQSWVEPLEINGFIKFFLSFIVSAPAYALILCAFLSLVYSGMYQMAKHDPELKEPTKNMFSVFIWKELKDK